MFYNIHSAKSSTFVKTLVYEASHPDRRQNKNRQAPAGRSANSFRTE